MSHHIRNRFPDQIQNIDQLIAIDPEFRDICEDYDICFNSLQYWIKSNEPEAETRVKEYRVLVRDLEEEVAQALTAKKV